MSPPALKPQLASRKVAFSFAFVFKQFPVALLGFKAEFGAMFFPSLSGMSREPSSLLLLRNKSLSPAPMELQFAVLSFYKTLSETGGLDQTF